MKPKLLLVLFLIGVLTSCTFTHQKAEHVTSEEDSVRRLEVAADVSKVDIADSIRILFSYPLSDGSDFRYTFLEFGSVGCAPCKQMEKEMEIIRTEFAGQVNVRFINLSKRWNREWADYFNIQVIPTQVILDSRGKEIYRHVGYIPADELKKVFK